MTEIFHAFNFRSLNESLFTLQGHNPWLLAAAGISLAATAFVLTIPFLADAFGLPPLSLSEILISFLLSVLILPLVEAEKWRRRKNHAVR
ncbi:MAG: hypothetical protein HFI93_10515 [Lachnospiraceae bacterium]|nr:hypothetical protein [Lachnospiraceae bacterium]